MNCSQCGRSFEDGDLLRQITQGIFNGEIFQEEEVTGTYHMGCVSWVAKEDPQGVDEE